MLDPPWSGISDFVESSIENSAVEGELGLGFRA
jgi:hypothetical protein